MFVNTISSTIVINTVNDKNISKTVGIITSRKSAAHMPVFQLLGMILRFFVLQRQVVDLKSTSPCQILLHQCRGGCVGPPTN